MPAAERLVVTCEAALLVVCVAVGAAAAAGGAAAGEGGLTRAQAEETVRAHNAWRRKVGARPLRWGPDLAARAQARAKELAAHGCLIEHGRLPRDIGENLYQAGPLHGDGRPDEVFAVSATHVVNMWGAESADYSREHDTCAWNRQCGHYTQIVWSTTTEVGCGMSICPSRGQVWVCNYRPRGNVRTRR
jgi:pathogenesis-related protein 1